MEHHPIVVNGEFVGLASQLRVSHEGHGYDSYQNAREPGTAHLSLSETSCGTAYVDTGIEVTFDVPVPTVSYAQTLEVYSAVETDTDRERWLVTELTHVYLDPISFDTNDEIVPGTRAVSESYTVRDATDGGPDIDVDIDTEVDSDTDSDSDTATTAEKHV